ncbi:hypothetical protein F5887DRAFT_1236729 [Amanita rubescens]|nr:hypothetical protein F5887DRAFT_1236729 [Amanita rubescens]
MLTTPDLRLKCLIEDEVTVFPVDVACNDELSVADKILSILSRFRILRHASLPITPSNSTANINEEIGEELKSLQPAVEAFLKNPELPIWAPPQHTMPDIHKFITELRIPTYPNGKPSLLLHGLDKCDGKKIKGVFEGATPLCICNTSGSGKTRRIMVALTKYWGFYLVATPDANGVGIRDLHDALELVARYREWVPDLRALAPEKRTNQNSINNQIAYRAFRRVLAARIVVFELFLQVATQINGALQAKHKRIWLLFQLFDQLNPQGGGSHPFIQIINKLRNASDDALDALVNRLDVIIKKYFPHSRPILGLDEAQWAARSYPCSGMSSSNSGAFRSIICEMVRAFTNAPVKIVVSGTGVSLADLEDSVASGVGKSTHKVKVFHELGMFNTWPKLKLFLERYVPASILNAPSWRCLQKRMQEYLRGRYRFTVSFLELFLMNGLQSPHKLLNKYLEQHITCPPGDTGLPFTSDEPDLRIKVELKGFDWERLRGTPHYGPVTAKLVEYGIARLREDHNGQIVEPLAFLSAIQWFEAHDITKLSTDIRLRGGDGNSRGYAFENAMVLYLLRGLGTPVFLNTIFHFHPEFTPSWADEKAQIQVVARLGGKYIPVNIMAEAPQNPGLCIVHYAETIDDVKLWSESTAKPRIVIVMARLKSYTRGNKATLDAQMLSKALTSLHPEHWSKQLVTGSPLTPDFGSEANSVTQAISRFDSSDALSWINLEPFLQFFGLEGEALNVLKLMESALARKRKASEMS